MEMKHMMLEVFCDANKNKKYSPCSKHNYKFGLHCFDEKCKYLSYTKCPNEIAYVNEEGVVENIDDSVGFGGDMEPDNIDNRYNYIEKWAEICREKINEAYEEYMKQMNSTI